MLQQYDSPNSQTYFFTTATLANYTNFNNLMKSAFALIEVPVTGAWPVNALTAIAYTGLWPANALTAISWTTGVVTATTTTAPGVLPGEYVSLSGCTPVGFNGTFLALDGTTNETLVYALATNPGAETVLGTLTASAGGTVTATTTTNHGVAVGQWFQITGCVPLAYNGWYQAILGTGTTSLVYAVPAAIGAESTLGSLVASTVALPGPAVTEFDCAAEFWQWLQQTPTQGNLLNPFAFRFLYGVTPWPPATFSSLFATLKAANVNIVGTGSEGGITTATSFWGTTMDGNDANFWYSVDWWAINSDIALANAIINGSNSQPPLDYDQNGINKLQSVLVGVMTQAVALGMALGQVVVTTLPAQTFAQNFANGVYSGQVVVNAVPFASYVALSPSDYPIGKYAGFSVAATPKRGFTQILFNINAVEFA